MGHRLKYTYNAAIESEPKKIWYSIFVAKLDESHVVEAEIVCPWQYIWIGIHLRKIYYF